MVDVVLVQVGDEVDEHAEAVAIAVYQHNLALRAHEANRPVQLARLLEVAVVRAEGPR